MSEDERRPERTHHFVFITVLKNGIKRTEYYRMKVSVADKNTYRMIEQDFIETYGE